MSEFIESNTELSEADVLAETKASLSKLKASLFKLKESLPNTVEQKKMEFSSYLKKEGLNKTDFPRTS
jgi:hypothetical protein